MTINHHLKVDEYPLPRIDGIYANLSGGKEYSVVDLQQAYLKMELNTHRGLYQYHCVVIMTQPLNRALWPRGSEGLNPY